MGKAEALSLARPALSDNFFSSASIGGADFRRFRDDLKQVGLQLEGLHTGEMARLIARAVETIANATCRLVVIGHAGAGKTTLVNAMLQRPGFLPCRSVAPTAAVTCIHLGAPKRPAHQAAFEFFSEDEWDRIVAQSGAMAGAGDHAASTVAADLAQVRVEQMRLRIERRLGGEFRKLFGKRHEYETLTPDLLLRYTRADTGPGTPASESSAAKYAGLTARAEIYRDENPFIYPVTLVDTPGMINLQHMKHRASIQELDRADAVIVVLCPRQLAAGWDAEFLRVLKRVPKDRAIIFINQPDTAAREPMNPTIARIQSVIAAELEGFIPIVTGSLARFTRPAGNVPAIAGAPLADADAATLPGTDSEKASGLSGLMSQFWQQLAAGPHARALIDSATTLHAVARERENNVRATAEVLKSSIDATKSERSLCDRKLREIETYVAQLSQLCVGIGKSCDMVAADVAKLQVTGLRDFETLIRGLVTPFVDSQCADLQAAFDAASEGEWVCDMSRIAEAVDDAVADAYRKWRLDLRTALLGGVESIKEAVVVGMPELAAEMPAASHAVEFSIPSFEILGDEIKFRLDQSWWRRWLQRRGNPAEMVAELRRLLEAEFERALAVALTALGRGLAGDSAAVLQGLSTRSIMVINMLVGRREQLTTTAKELTALRDSEYAESKLDGVVAEHGKFEKLTAAAGRLDQAFGELVLRGAMMFGMGTVRFEQTGL